MVTSCLPLFRYLTFFSDEVRTEFLCLSMDIYGKRIWNASHIDFLRDFDCNFFIKFVVKLWYNLKLENRSSLASTSSLIYCLTCIISHMISTSKKTQNRRLMVFLLTPKTPFSQIRSVKWSKSEGRVSKFHWFIIENL